MRTACREKEVNGRRYRCFFELTLQLIGGKWKPVVLYHLAQDGVLRFGELRRGLPGITERMLTRCLRELEADGLVRREVYREVPPRVEYALTDLGASLIPVLRDMRDWGARYEERTAGRAFAGEGYEPRPQPPEGGPGA